MPLPPPMGRGGFPGRSAASRSRARRTRTPGTPEPRARPRPSAARRSSLLIELLPGRPDLLVDVPAVDRVAVAVQRPRPRGNRILIASELQQHVAVVILNDGIGLLLI